MAPEAATARHPAFPINPQATICGRLISAICILVLGLVSASPAHAQVIEPPQAYVSTPKELQDALNAAASSEFRCLHPYVIWVENNASIDMDGFMQTEGGTQTGDGITFLLSIPSCVTLASGRSATLDGGLLHQNSTDAFQQFMLSLGNGTRVTGLRLQGPSSSSRNMAVANGAILIDGVSTATVDNNEIFNWPHSAVNVTNASNNHATAQQISVSNNFIHDNVMCGLGYGVVVGKAGYAYISRNLFDNNRHAVSDDGCVSGGNECTGDTGYIAELNFVLAEGAECPSSNSVWNALGWFDYYNQHFDVHGRGSGCGSISPLRGSGRATVRDSQQHDPRRSDL